jgi:hypothetical protein
MTIKGPGRTLHHGPSMISPLYDWYETHRGERTERKIAQRLIE